ncbi:hypothetical protein ACFSCX_21335 [Bacillus salitolerans]|uniref:Phosphatase n=1 Tax=Bacillus salitolerans TaxID=1437434 RepID=A0ABW4LVV0_9BACI
MKKLFLTLVLVASMSIFLNVSEISSNDVKQTEPELLLDPIHPPT